MDTSAKSVEGVGDASKSTAKTMGKSLRNWAVASGAVAAGAKVFKDAIGNAVDLGEEINKTSVVFRGPGAKALIDWSKGSATAMGISRQQALSAAGVFGNMLVPMGFARDRAASMSKNMVQLAGDMASFNNASPEETLDALRAGLAGETEPLRRFGVFLSDARVKQQAMDMGLYKGKGNLTASARAAATYALTLKDTKDAQGDFQRTSDSLANRQRVLKAQYADLTANLGQKLLPILTVLANNLNTVAVAVGALTAMWMVYRTVTTLAAAGTIALNASILLIPLAIIAIGAALVIAYQKVGWFRAAVQAVFNWIKGHWPLLVAILGGPFGAAAVLIIKNFDKIKTAASSVWNAIKSTFGKVKGFLKSVFTTDFVSGIGRGIADWLNAHTPFGDTIDLGIKKIHIPALAEGGTITTGGSVLVGERGPELLTLPGGASVTPLPVLSGVGGPMTTNLYLDRRLVASAVAQRDADVRARR
jgi:hypothetical protein